MYARIYISIFLLVVCSFACSSSLSNPSKQEPVLHVVLVWLKEAGNKEHIQQVIEVSNQLEAMSEIQDLKAGKSISSKRKIVDDSFDVGIYMMFANKADMERYLLSEKHKRAVDTVLKPLSKKILVYDFSISSFDSNYK